MNKWANMHPNNKQAKAFQTPAWLEPLRQAFWSNPNLLLASKATLAIALLAVPLVILGHSFIAVTLALGALAGALSETDDHPKGRIKSLVLKVVSFGISSLAVELLRPYPIILGLGLGVSTIVFLLIGGISERYRGVTFGAVLVGIYAMLGTEISPAWYWQPLLLPAGALFYGLFSLALLYYHPWRLLEEQLARGYLALSEYLNEKAALFPSDEKHQEKIRNQLALQNVQVVDALERCKEVLNSYGDALTDHAPLRPYLHYFIVLQGLHERAASSHERYDVLSRDPHNQELLEGIGQTLIQLSQATRQFATSLLTNVPYRHPVSLGWVVQVLTDQLEKHKPSDTHPLALLIRNLARSHQSLLHLSENQPGTLSPRLAKDQRSLMQRLKAQLSWDHPRLRHAIRLSLCFLIGFAISEGFNVAKGEWIILTSLFVCQPSYSETRRKLFQRILGTISGVVGGVLIVQLLPTMPGQLLLLLAAAFLFFFWLRRRYAVSVIFITIFVLSVFNLVANKGVALMLPRLIDTLIGSALAYATVRLLWPDWQSKRLPTLLNEAIQKNTAYFQAIIQEYQQQEADDDLPYRIARREAHRADNALVLAWQNMQVEPRKQQRFREQAFSLTYLNHALLSYLSAFGAHREQRQPANSEQLILANEILKVLQEAHVSAQKDKELIHLQSIQKQIRLRIKSSQQDAVQMQFTLLYNIADVTIQLLQQADFIQQAQPQATIKTEISNA
ncbi:YccS family putative transporter [uncultured Sunxiuqinia sp.]|uniref:YccS family putative transporter n=1 Tax=uncultured Sunxiuqinia sp. TaxID=1573825 RepID=UPI00262E7A40|nr:YccS family putative transporter [uncultured Sunxiuqinia sp.]